MLYVIAELKFILDFSCAVDYLEARLLDSSIGIFIKFKVAVRMPINFIPITNTFLIDDIKSSRTWPHGLFIYNHLLDLGT